MRPPKRLLVATIAADSLALLLAFVLAHHWRVPDRLHAPEPAIQAFHPYAAATAWLIALWLLTYWARGLYADSVLQHDNGATLLGKIASAAAYAALATLALTYLTGTAELSRGWLVTSGLGAWAFTFAARSAVRFGLRRYRRAHPWRVLIAGAGQAGALAAEMLGRQRAITVVGYLDDFLALGTVVNGRRVLARPSQLPILAKQEAIDEVLVVDGALAAESHEHLLRQSYSDPSLPRLAIVPSASGELLMRRTPAQRGSLPILTPEMGRIAGLGGFVKSAADRATAFLVLVLVSPVFLVAGLWSLLHHRPLLYGTPMIGKGGRRFRRWSFAAWWSDDPDVSDTLRLAGTAERGYLVRLFRKLPRALNVLQGDLSLVGPRPVAALELTLYSEWATVLFSVRPGLVGPWLLHGEANFSPEEELRLDLAYVRDHSLARDGHILVRSVSRLLHRAWRQSAERGGRAHPAVHFPAPTYRPERVTPVPVLVEHAERPRRDAADRVGVS